MRHLHIAILTQGWVRWELSNYLHQLCLGERRLHFSICYYEGRGMEGRPVSSNRNRIIRDRPEGSDLIMMDSDVIPRKRLFEIALQDLDIVICPTPIWKAARGEGCPVEINLEAMTEDKVMALGAETYDQLVSGGTGAIYISSAVLDDPKMHAPFKFLTDEDGVTRRGEDYAFCDLATECGYQIHAANAILCGHYQEVNLLTVMQRFYEMQTAAEEAIELGRWADED